VSLVLLASLAAVDLSSLAGWARQLCCVRGSFCSGALWQIYGASLRDLANSCWSRTLAAVSCSSRLLIGVVWSE
jgi:hypothetical protein